MTETKALVWEGFGEAMEQDFSEEETEPGDSGLGSLITGVEVLQSCQTTLQRQQSRVDEIRANLLKALDVVGLSWLSNLGNTAWTLGTVPLE